MRRLDLRKDFDEVYNFIADRARSFDSVTNNGPGEGGPITQIDLGFGLYQSGWVALVFDTRPDAEPDGDWNEYIDGNDLDQPHWAEACDALEEEPLTIVLPDGLSRKMPAGDNLAAILGEMLKEVLLKARADGLFAELPKAPRCHLGVEEQEGSYGWPAYEDRGRENLA